MGCFRYLFSLDQQCDPSWIYTEHGDACYKTEPLALTWDLAEQNCVNKGAHLTSIHSQEELDFVHGKSATASQFTQL